MAQENIAQLNIDGSTYLIHHRRNRVTIFESLAAATYPAGLILGRRTADGFYLPYVVGAVDGTEVPSAVLMKEVVAAAGAVEFPMNVLIDGEVRDDLTLVWTAGVPVPATAAVKDVMRTYNILFRPSTETKVFENAVP